MTTKNNYRMFLFNSEELRILRDAVGMYYNSLSNVNRYFRGYDGQFNELSISTIALLQELNKAPTDTDSSWAIAINNFIQQQLEEMKDVLADPGDDPENIEYPYY